MPAYAVRKTSEGATLPGSVVIWGRGDEASWGRVVRLKSVASWLWMRSKLSWVVLVGSLRRHSLACWACVPDAHVTSSP
ncbi:MAG: hypothetical protein WDA27_14890 [Actinomycetota bacterium]